MQPSHSRAWCEKNSGSCGLPCKLSVSPNKTSTVTDKFPEWRGKVHVISRLSVLLLPRSVYQLLTFGLRSSVVILGWEISKLCSSSGSLAHQPTASHFYLREWQCAVQHLHQRNDFLHTVLCEVNGTGEKKNQTVFRNSSNNSQRQFYMLDRTQGPTVSSALQRCKKLKEKLLIMEKNWIMI